ncbi:VIR protein [Plasmodium vivax]|uniref:VIR protein n=1 Tax=Plasmodium vivax TaxID=5855 RepID=A0A1G4GSA1_PLAVI|nr:VIR protein [Plasmodium vivax]
MLSFNDSLRKNDLESLCCKFKYLYDLVFVTFVDHSPRNNENSEYVNYWLNKELKSKNMLSTTAEEFYQKLINNDSSFDREKKLMNKMHYINEEHLKKMDILYELNTIYNNIKSIYDNDKQKCIDYSNECVQKYTEAIIPCSTDKNTKYCDVLKAFKNKYKNIDSTNLFGGCNAEYLLPLASLEEENEHNATVTDAGLVKSEVETRSEEKNEKTLKTQDDLEVKHELENSMQPSLSPKEENNYDNNISIFTIFGIILSISVFSSITYKFTPFGSWINRRLKRNKTKWRSAEDEKETESLLEYNYDPKHLVLRNVPYSASYNSL